MESAKALLLALLSTIGSGATHADEQVWPALPDKGFISGRPATTQDVKEGNAVFSAQKDGKLIGKPLGVVIPQYAYWTDASGHKTLVIVIQAEAANEFELFGLRDASGTETVCTRPELILLGATRPN